MVYTIQNHCTEDSSIPYNDGAKKIFLYTKGTEGNSSQPLKDMLKYIQESTEDNVTNQDIASIQKFVTKVKHKKEVGINYMKSWEVEKAARDQGYHDGFDDGFDDATQKMSQLIVLLTQAGRTDDILKIAQDPNYRAQLFAEFGL